MTVKKIESVTQLAGLLKSIFIGGRFYKDLPVEVQDGKGRAIITITAEDPSRWVPTPYQESFASTRKLCTKKEWETLSPAKQVDLCDCWESLAVMEYLDLAYDSGNRFEVADYEC